MNKNKTSLVLFAGFATAFAITLAAVGSSGAAKDQSSKTAQSSVTTNENGSVSRTFVESTLSTNGNMVTEHRRETRTTMDMTGNVLETSTSEYTQTYPAGSFFDSPQRKIVKDDKQEPVKTDSFLSLKFGEKIVSTNFVEEVGESTFLRAKFTPAKPLAGFDDYYVYVTPETHRVAKIYACAKQTVDPGVSWRRHYLIEALEKRYRTWARLCSYRRPAYTFDLGDSRHVTACLDGASKEYATIIAAWDDDMCDEASREREKLDEQARRKAAEKRLKRVDAASAAF